MDGAAKASLGNGPAPCISISCKILTRLGGHNQSRGDGQLLALQNNDLAFTPKKIRKRAITKAPPFPFQFNRIVSSWLRKMRFPVMTMSMTRRNSSCHPHEWPEGLKAWAAFKKSEEAPRGITEFLSQEDNSDLFFFFSFFLDD